MSGKLYIKYIWKYQWIKKWTSGSWDLFSAVKTKQNESISDVEGSQKKNKLPQYALELVIDNFVNT